MLPSSPLHQLWTATRRTGTRSGTLPFIGEPPRPPTHGLAYPALPPARVGAEPAARDPVTRRWGPPLAGSPPASATERTETEASLVVTQVGAEPNAEA